MDFLSQATGAGDLRAENAAAVAPIADKFPALARVLMGQWNSDGTLFRSPGSIRLFTNGGRIKVMLWGQDWTYNGFVTLPEGEISLELIEKLIIESKVDWAKAKDQKLGSTNTPSF